MCMTVLDDVKKRHRIGLKIVQVVDETRKKFKSTVMGATYHLGEWYDAGDPQFLMGMNAAKHSPQGKIGYKAGIHYFRFIPHTEKRCVILNPVDYAIVKVKLKGVLETGEECGADAGVARMICPIAIVDGAKELNWYMKDNLQKLLDLTDAKWYMDIYLNRSSDNPTPDEMNMVIERCTKADLSYAQFIQFLDMFARQHPLFKFFTLIHLNLYKMEPKYKFYYSRMVKMVPDMETIQKNLHEEILKHGIRYIDGPVA